QLFETYAAANLLLRRCPPKLKKFAEKISRKGVQHEDFPRGHPS
ncbi:unnamed protein product, partial [Linum tenue]